MKHRTIYFALTIFSFFSCDCKKNVITGPDELKNTEKIWTLNYITGSRIAFDGLYPDKKPHMVFYLGKNEINGFTSCNSFSSKIKIWGDSIAINPPRQTMIMCKGNGEISFTNMLSKVNTYIIKDGKLELLSKNVVMMRFE